MSQTTFPGSTRHGTWPEPYTIRDDPETGRITLATSFYEVRHDRGNGGAITGIRCSQASGRNLLLAPIACEVVLEDGERRLGTTGAGPNRVRVSPTATGARLEVSGNLHDSTGSASAVEYLFVYEYRWGMVRLRQTLRFPHRGLRVRRVTLLALTLRPELATFGVRAGIHAETSPDPGDFGVLQCGRFKPGRAFDCACESRSVPRYVVCAEPGREGLEWFPCSELAQWDYQLGGRPGRGHFRLMPETGPAAVRCEISPLHLPRGGIRLAGDATFESWLGVPIISGRAHRPFLHKSFDRRNWPAAATIRNWAAAGVGTAHFHHDGDRYGDGLFWRDGCYPPFGPDDMRAYDRVLRSCRDHGIRTATYFSNKELHTSTRAYAEQAGAWTRLPGDRAEPIHTSYQGHEYGVLMCLRSGWLEQLKKNIDRVLSNHPLDGVYYDWNVALYCHNTGHDGGPAPAPRGRRTGGGLALSPAGHWDVDELLELMAWTRQRVGRDGLVIVHNSMVPCAASENFADHVVAMEWGYAKLATGAPALADLPLEWSFLGARPRAVIGYGCLEPEAPEAVHRQMTLRCLLTGVAPWPARDLDLDMFAVLRNLDAETCRFYDWRCRVAETDAPDTAAAAYAGPDGALILVANLTAAGREIRLRLHPERVGLPATATVRTPSGRRPAPAREPFTLTLPANGLVPLRVEPGKS